MKKLFLMGCMLALMATNAAAFDDGDFQVWNTDSISWKINDKWSAKIEEEVKFGDNSTDFYYHHTDIGIVYKDLADWFDLGLNYRLAFEEKNGNFQYENRPHLNGTIKFKLDAISISDRSRLEFRDKESSKDGWRYRNKVTVKFPSFKKVPIQPYVADEVFYDFVKDKLNKNRIYAGFSVKFWENWKGDVYYLLESAKSGKSWSDLNVLGTKVNFSF